MVLISSFSGVVSTSPVFGVEFNFNVVQGQTRDSSFLESNPGFGEVSGSTGTSQAHSSAYLNLQPGALIQAASLGASRSDGTVGSITTSSTAGYREHLIIDAAGLDGMTGVINADIAINERLSGSGGDGTGGGGTTFIDLQLGDDTRSFSYIGSSNHVPPDPFEFTQTNSTTKLIHLSTTFVFGDEFWLGLNSETEISGTDLFHDFDGPVHYNVSSNIALYWAGISSVMSPDGTVLDDFTITSETGHDYTVSSNPVDTRPVPEAGTASAIALGIIATAIAVRKLRRPRLQSSLS
ncbi:MAG TPA: hypothetical protein VFT72_08070 [Opitutaceae bacterium]|nr:hypothetical protein [Opitutaceae bacterium]